MNKLDLAARLAREAHQSRGKAADVVDNLVYRLLKDLRLTTPSLSNRTPLGQSTPKPTPKRPR